MGVLDADENISEEMQRIMDFYNEYTTDDLHVITFGDELTHERTVNVQEDMRRGRTRKDRWERTPCPLTKALAAGWLAGWLAVTRVACTAACYCDAPNYLNSDVSSLACNYSACRSF